MENKTITDEMVARLIAPLPAEAITENKQKTFLSSIKPIYVTQRLNEVFGYGTWRTKVELVAEKEDGTTVVKTTLEIPEYGVYLEQFGGHQDKDLGDSFKSSATDALTKCASYLGIGLDVFMGKQTHKTPNVTQIQSTCISMPSYQSEKPSTMPLGFSVSLGSYIADNGRINLEFNDMNKMTSKEELLLFKNKFVDVLPEGDKRKSIAMDRYNQCMQRLAG